MTGIVRSAGFTSNIEVKVIAACVCKTGKIINQKLIIVETSAWGATFLTIIAIRQSLLLICCILFRHLFFKDEFEICQAMEFCEKCYV